MLHTVLIADSPEMSSKHQEALEYCYSILDSGGQLKQVFFMHEATQTATHLQAQPWSKFAAQNQVELQTCISSADNYSMTLQDYADGFLQGGFSVLADSILSSDVIVQMSNASELGVDRQSVTDKNKVLFVFESQPQEGSLAAEGIDLLLVLSAFDANIHIIFVGDGIKNLNNKDVNPRYVKRFKALPDFDVSNCYIVINSSEESYDNLSLSCDKMTQQQFTDLTQNTHTLFF